MTADPADLAREEFRSLRATIRERGTLRLLVIAITFVAWGTLGTVVLLLNRVPGLTLVPLLVLAAGFEVAFAAHVGVERIGRYLHARYEGQPGGPFWEHAAMSGGPRPPGLDPLARRLFAAATILNLLPAVLWVATRAYLPVAWLVLLPEALAHALVLVRLSAASKFAAGQRARDLEHFRRELGKPEP